MLKMRESVDAVSVGGRITDAVLFGVPNNGVIVPIGADTVMFEVGRADVVTFVRLSGRPVDAVALITGIVTFALLEGDPLGIGVAVLFPGTVTDSLVTGVAVVFPGAGTDALGTGVAVPFAGAVGDSVGKLTVALDGAVVAGVGLMVIISVVVVVLLIPGSVIVVLNPIDSVIVVTLPDGPVKVTVVILLPPEKDRDGIEKDRVPVGGRVVRVPLEGEEPGTLVTGTSVPVEIVALADRLGPGIVKALVVSVPGVSTEEFAGLEVGTCGVCEVAEAVSFVGKVVTLGKGPIVLPKGTVMLTAGTELVLAEGGTPIVEGDMELGGGD